MKKCIPLIILALAVSGCATEKTRKAPTYKSDQEWKLSRAVTLTEEGNRSAADQVLTHITKEPAVPGVTDAALFRLALLRLHPDLGPDGMAESRKQLKKLMKDYPSGSWTPLAAKLVEMIDAAEESVKREGRLKKENGRLKELNVGLMKDNSEYRQAIQKLKALEVELGKGGKGL